MTPIIKKHTTISKITFQTRYDRFKLGLSIFKAGTLLDIFLSDKTQAGLIMGQQQYHDTAAGHPQIPSQICVIFDLR